MGVYSVPDVKAVVMAYLKGAQAAPVVSKRPDTSPPPEFVRVIGTGGPGRSQRVLQTVQLTIDSYSASTGKAYTLAATVDALMAGLPASDQPITSVSSTTPAEFPDPDTGQSRYTATYQLSVRCL